MSQQLHPQSLCMLLVGQLQKLQQKVTQLQQMCSRVSSQSLTAVREKKQSRTQVSTMVSCVTTRTIPDSTFYCMILMYWQQR